MRSGIVATSLETKSSVRKQKELGRSQQFREITFLCKPGRCTFWLLFVQYLYLKGVCECTVWVCQKAAFRLTWHHHLARRTCQWLIETKQECSTGLGYGVNPRWGNGVGLVQHRLASITSRPSLWHRRTDYILCFTDHVKFTDWDL